MRQLQRTCVKISDLHARSSHVRTHLQGDVQRDGSERLSRLPGVLPPLCGRVGGVEQHQQGEGQEAAVEALGHVALEKRRPTCVNVLVKKDIPKYGTREFLL